VYYFPDENIMNIAHRVLVHDATSFKIFCDFSDDARPMLYLWKRDQEKSPDFAPAAEGEEKSASGTSGGSAQTVWANTVKDLDGKRCVVCAVQGSGMIAAHLTPFATPIEKFREAALASAYDAKNGLTMCPNCSAEFDAGSFYFDIDGTLHYPNLF